MIRTSVQGRSARGRAADTAARPPTWTKSSISVVTNRTFKKLPRASTDCNYARMVPVFAGLVGPVDRLRHGVRGNRFPGAAAQFRVTPRRQGARWRKFGMTITGIDEGNLTKSFQGLRVLDFSTTIAGPHCTRMLADMGAEVIKIETAEGETMRTRPPVRNHCSTAFGQLNIGKNSCVLDLKSTQGVEAVRRLVATADVLVENFRPGVMRRL